MYKNKRIIAVVPAYNAAKTIKNVIDDMPEFIDEVLVVDDCSTDHTSAIAESLGVSVIRHPHNLGYGANQKTCYSYALEKGYDVIIMVHGDYQYDPKYAESMIRPIVSDQADLVLGNRMKTAQQGKMPLYKIVGNHVHSFLMNILLGTHFKDFATGYKAYSKQLLEAVDFINFRDGFIFDEELNVYALKKKMRLINVDVPTKYFEDMSSVNLRTSVIYFFQTYFVILKSCFVKH